MDSRRKIAAISARLGHPKQTAPKKGEYGFLCPGKPGSGGCTSAPQGKVRLWINPDRDQFHCWHCGYRGASLAPLMVRGSAEQREYLAERHEIGVAGSRKHERPPCTALPHGFTPFRLSGDQAEAPYLHYLRSRGISDLTVKLYRMGYVSFGKLSGRVIIPSFDHTGALNFWSARSIYETEMFRYRLPDSSKDIVSNEHMKNWARPVYIVEGIFDEIAIGPQAISLYGKFMPPKLALRLVEHRPPLVYVCLDSDARGEAEDLVERLLGYDLPCSLVDLDGKDPGSIGLRGVEDSCLTSQILTGSHGKLELRLR